MAAPAGKKPEFTIADLTRFAIIIGLGLLSALTFLVACTIVILMAVEGSGCECFTTFPVGLAVLGLLGLFLLIDLINEATYGPGQLQKWFTESDKNRYQVLLAVISLVAIGLVMRA